MSALYSLAHESQSWESQSSTVFFIFNRSLNRGFSTHVIIVNGASGRPETAFIISDFTISAIVAASFRSRALIVITVSTLHS
jgi:hypothetical protein